MPEPCRLGKPFSYALGATQPRKNLALTNGRDGLQNQKSDPMPQPRVWPFSALLRAFGAKCPYSMAGLAWAW